MQLKWEPPPLLAAASGLRANAQNTSPQPIARSPESIIKAAAVGVFFGGSGSSKTTLLSVLGHRAAACGVLSLSASMPGEDWCSCVSPMVPVFARCAELAASLKRYRGKVCGLLDLLADHLAESGSASKPELARLLRRDWLAGQLLLLAGRPPRVPLIWMSAILPVVSELTWRDTAPLGWVLRHLWTRPLIVLSWVKVRPKKGRRKNGHMR